jgi:hypothetical protein
MTAGQRNCAHGRYDGMSGKIVTLVAALALAGAVPVYADGDPGSWQPQKTELDYMGFTTTYSCDGLQSKLEMLLRQLGASSDAKVQAYGCDRFNGPSKFARASLKFATLHPVASDTDPAVPGKWRAVEFSPRRPFALGYGDCELIEQFRDKVLPLFATRELQGSIHCVPHQLNSYSLKFQVFAPIAATHSK